MSKFEEGDYYIDKETGYKVMTEQFHLRRGTFKNKEQGNEVPKDV